MASYGTTQKCKACDKTVHFVEMMSADGVPFHKNCFKCSECNGRLAMSNYSAVDGKLYCKAHFEQVLKETATAGMKIPPSGSGKAGELNNKSNPSRVSSFFSGTQEKCQVCKKTVYPLEKVTMEGEFYHKSCFRCAHGGCFLTTSNNAALDGILYCKPHFSQLFKEKGSYTQITKTRKSAVAPDPDVDQTPPPHDIQENIQQQQQEEIK